MGRKTHRHEDTQPSNQFFRSSATFELIVLGGMFYVALSSVGFVKALAFVAFLFVLAHPVMLVAETAAGSIVGGGLQKHIGYVGGHALVMTAGLWLLHIAQTEMLQPILFLALALVSVPEYMSLYSASRFRSGGVLVVTLVILWAIFRAFQG